MHMKAHNLIVCVDSMMMSDKLYLSCFMCFLSFSDELSGILKKLSLEKYQPIFEEQEVFCLSRQRGIQKHFPSQTKSVFPMFHCVLIHDFSM